MLTMTMHEKLTQKSICPKILRSFIFVIGPQKRRISKNKPQHKRMLKLSMHSTLFRHKTSKKSQSCEVSKCLRPSSLLLGENIHPSILFSRRLPPSRLLLGKPNRLSCFPGAFLRLGYCQANPIVYPVFQAPSSVQAVAR